VDDHSPNKFFVEEFLADSPLVKDTGSMGFQHKPQLVLHRTPEQLGFAGALQYGFERSEEPWVVFMHSDCVIEDKNWLIEMGQSLLNLKEQNVRMVSAKTNNPGEDAYKELKSSKGEYGKDIVLTDGCLPLYCAMSHRELFNRIGGFVKPYPFGWYEDEELAHRMRKHGFKQAVCGRSWVRHEGGVTIDQLWKDRPETRKIMAEDNRERCIVDIKTLG
jgi:GT2 family glycosyltransferase